MYQEGKTAVLQHHHLSSRQQLTLSSICSLSCSTSALHDVISFWVFWVTVTTIIPEDGASGNIDWKSVHHRNVCQAETLHSMKITIIIVITPYRNRNINAIPLFSSSGQACMANSTLELSKYCPALMRFCDEGKLSFSCYKKNC